MIDIEEAIMYLWKSKYRDFFLDTALYAGTMPYFYLGYKNFNKKYRQRILEHKYPDMYHPLNLTKHTWISGVQGSGKSNKLRRIFINSFVKPGWGGIYIDTHGTADIILQSIPPNRWKDVIYIAPWMGRVYGLNPLRRYTNDLGERDRIAEDVVEIFRKMYPRSWGDKLANTIRFATKAVLIAAENDDRFANPTLLDVYKFLTDQSYRNNVKPYVDNDIIIGFFENLGKNNASAKLEAPLSSDNVLYFLCQPQGLDFLQCMDERKIIICNLDKDHLSENANLIAGLLISVIAQCAAKRSESTFHPYFAIAMDEFYEYANKHISVLIAQMRKKNVCVLLANQYRNQMTNADIQDAVSMCQNKFIHTVADADLAWVTKLYDKWFDKKVIASIPYFHCIADIHNPGTPKAPKFIATPEFIPDYNREYGNMLKYASLSFAPNRYKLKEEIDISLLQRVEIDTTVLTNNEELILDDYKQDWSLTF